LENDKTMNRVQTQMYVAMQIAAALSALCAFHLYSDEIIKNFKIESPLSWSTISETSDLIVAGHQIGEAELLLPKLKTKKFRNK
jgi:methionyl-tRNA synthetase